MTLPSPVSSAINFTAPVEVSPATQAKLDALAVDEPLPELPARDLARLLVQSPYRIFFYWSFKRHPFETAQRAFGTSDDFELCVRLIDVSSTMICALANVPGFTRDYWFNVEPNRRYRAEIGLRRAARPFIRLLASNIVQTPRATVSPFVDTEKFAVAPSEFVGVLESAGFMDDAFQVVEQAIADFELHQRGAAWSAQLDFQEELKYLAALLAAGKTFEQIRHLLSARASEFLSYALQNRLSLLTALNAIAHSRTTRTYITHTQAGSLVTTTQDFNQQRSWLPSLNNRF